MLLMQPFYVHFSVHTPTPAGTLTDVSVSLYINRISGVDENKEVSYRACHAPKAPYAVSH